MPGRKSAHLDHPVLGSFTFHPLALHRIANELTVLQGYAPNQTYSFAENEILDWTITHADGSEEGNIVGKFLDTQQR